MKIEFFSTRTSHVHTSTYTCGEVLVRNTYVHTYRAYPYVLVRIRFILYSGSSYAMGC